MSHGNIVRAWKDEEYRLSLSEAERSRLPEKPVGAIALTDADLAGTAGGSWRPLARWVIDWRSWRCVGRGIFRGLGWSWLTRKNGHWNH